MSSKPGGSRPSRQKTAGFQSAPRATITAAGPAGASSPPWMAPRQCRQNSSICRRVKKSPLAMTGTPTASQTCTISPHFAGSAGRSWRVRMCTATASAPLRSQSCMKSRVFATVSRSLILQVRAQLAGRLRRSDLRMSAASSGVSSRAAPMPPFTLKDFGHPMLMSMPRTSPATSRAARVASAASAVPSWKNTLERSSAQVLKTATFSSGDTKSTVPNAGSSVRRAPTILRSRISSP
mmetsp:Transcript_120494/g.341445  ORF Transcript_120494/g.341445 Transcript_120494/m.341445 type:complete len:237 (-) Transcript_120494:276-986(-)